MRDRRPSDRRSARGKRKRSQSPMPASALNSIMEIRADTAVLAQRAHRARLPLVVYCLKLALLQLDAALDERKV